jgi:double-stranded uracil-DNA glycosylase
MNPEAAYPTLPDVLTEGLSVVFCGINPGARAAASGHHFDGRGNRFWRVLHLAGFTPEQLRPENDHSMLHYGYGLTTVAPRPTARANQLSAQEIQAAGPGFTLKIQSFAPRHIAFLGKMAFSALTEHRHPAWGLQAEAFAGAQAWILPNPSGLNRSFSLDQLVTAYQELQRAVTARP